MNNAHGWLLRSVDCESCGGVHDLYFDEEPEIHRDVIFTCPVTETSTRLREWKTPEPLDEPVMSVVTAHAT